MVATCVIGAQWGDEGKGKIIDLLAAQAELVVRFSGGNNAGHTVVTGSKRYAMHLLPSGILRPAAVNVIGAGVVVDPWHLRREIDELRALGVSVDPGRNLLVSRSAHLVLPYHRRQDRILEELRGEGRIGTTGRGIGPAYADRASRTGLRFGDLGDPGCCAGRLRAALAEKNPSFERAGLGAIDPAALLDELREVAEPLLPAAADTGRYLRRRLAEGAETLFEGAQGMLLDVDLGSYPYVTSTATGPGGVAAGAEVGPRAIDRVLAVSKAYCTRVGEGPFPTECAGAALEALRARGGEFGTTTGRARRCGWLDAVALRYALELSAADSLCVTKLDVLSGLDRVEVGVAYELDGERLVDFPAGRPGLERVRVEYAELEGWQADLAAVRREEDLPGAARAYLAFLEAEVGVRVGLVSVGPERGQLVSRC